MEANYRLKENERVRGGAEYENGVTQLDKVRPAPRGLRRLYRPPGRILPYSHTQIQTQAASVCSSWAGLPIQGPPIRPVTSSLDIYSGDEQVPRVFGATGYSHRHVSGRLAHSGSVPPGRSEECGHYPGVVCASGTKCKYGKIGIRPLSVIHVPGGSIQHIATDDNAYNAKVRGVVGYRGKVVDASKNCSSVGLADVARQADFAGETGPLGSVSHEGNTAGSEEPVASVSSFTPQRGGGVTDGGEGDQVVVGPGEPIPLHITCPSFPHDGALHRQLDGRLGCAPGVPGGPGHLAPISRRRPHQRARDEGRPRGLAAVGPESQRSVSNDLHGQHLSNVIHKLSGGHGEYTVVPPGSTTPVAGRLVGHQVEGSSYSGQEECASRLSVEGSPNDSDGMDPEPGGVPGPVPEVGNPQGRSVRHKPKRPVGELHVSSPRSVSSGGRCNDPELEPGVMLCLSPQGSNQRDSLQDSEGGVSGRVGADSSSSAPRQLVGGVAGPSHRPVGPARRPRPAVPRKAHTPGPVSPPPSRLQVIKKALRKEGFSRTSIRQYNARVADSTSKVYDGKWKVFLLWCSDQNIRYDSISEANFAKFLTELRARGLKCSTIASYRTAVLNTLVVARGPDLSGSAIISGIIKGFRRGDVSARSRVPPWSLSVVCQILRGHPFEPLDVVPLKFVTLKFVFLLALASGRRRSELHALTFQGVRWGNRKRKVSLRVNVDFMSKTQLARGCPLAPLEITALSELVGSDRDENLLCPVRCLRRYLSRTRLPRSVSSSKKLIISYAQGFKGEISADTVSRYIKECIILCHAESDRANNEPVRRIAQVSAHQVRAVAASMTYFEGASLSECLEVGSWMSHNTFTSFYLRDLSEECDNVHTFAPAFVGGRPILPH